MRTVSGWVDFVGTDGQPIAPAAIDETALRRAAHAFIDEQDGRLLDSIVLASDLQKALGIDLGRTGWWVTLAVPDDVQLPDGAVLRVVARDAERSGPAEPVAKVDRHASLPAVRPMPPGGWQGTRKLAKPRRPGGA